MRVSFDIPDYTSEIAGLGTIRLLEAIRESGLKPKFHQASLSEMFGKVQDVPQRETTPFYPRSPYGAAKVYSYWITVNYREAYDLFACNGILFNHESPRRGETFVKRRSSLVAEPAAVCSRDTFHDSRFMGVENANGGLFQHPARQREHI